MSSEHIKFFAMHMGLESIQKLEKRWLGYKLPPRPQVRPSKRQSTRPKVRPTKSISGSAWSRKLSNKLEIWKTGLPDNLPKQGAESTGTDLEMTAVAV
jgi:hypothetical protein